MMVRQEKWTLLNPTVTAKRAITLAPRLDTLAGKTVGVIWNGRPPGDMIFNQMFEILRAKYEIGDVVIRRKAYLGNVASPEVFDELADRCDVVVTGVGD